MVFVFGLSSLSFSIRIHMSDSDFAQLVKVYFKLDMGLAGLSDLTKLMGVSGKQFRHTVEK